MVKDLGEKFIDDIVVVKEFTNQVKEQGDKLIAVAEAARKEFKAEIELAMKLKHEAEKKLEEGRNLLDNAMDDTLGISTQDIEHEIATGWDNLKNLR